MSFKWIMFHSGIGLHSQNLNRNLCNQHCRRSQSQNQKCSFRRQKSQQQNRHRKKRQGKLLPHWSAPLRQPLQFRQSFFRKQNFMMKNWKKQHIQNKPKDLDLWSRFPFQSCLKESMSFSTVVPLQKILYQQQKKHSQQCQNPRLKSMYRFTCWEKFLRIISLQKLQKKTNC